MDTEGQIPPNIVDAFESAVARHKAGQLDAAENIYREILRRQPHHVDATHMLGMIAYQRGQYAAAIDLITKALQRSPSSAVIYSNLGSVYIADDQPDAAIAALQRALKLDPSMALAYNNLGNALRMKNSEQEAIAAYEKAIEISPLLADAHANLGAVYYQNSDYEIAKKYFLKAVELNPEHASARHMLLSLSGEFAKSAPLEHVRQLFDEYAARFDKHLVEDLGYSMPVMIRGELEKIAGRKMRFRSVIDLGCGTGLAGSEFAALADRLTGVDISARMVEKARTRGIYDVLQAGSIHDWLNQTNEKYDLFLCADVFPYIGEITELFKSVRHCAMDGAYFAFSTEHTDEKDLVLRNTGRYAHSSDFIRRVALDTGFSVITLRTENLRKQKGTWTPGDLVVLQASSASAPGV